MRRSFSILFLATLFAGMAAACAIFMALDYEAFAIFATRATPVAQGMGILCIGLVSFALVSWSSTLAARCPGGRGDFSLAGAPRVSVVATWFALGACIGTLAGPLGFATRYGRAGTFATATASLVLSIVFALLFGPSENAGGTSSAHAPRAAAIARTRPGFHPILSVSSLMLGWGVTSASVAWIRIARVHFGADAITGPQLAASASACVAIGLYAGARLSRRAAFPAIFAAAFAALGGLSTVIPLRWLHAAVVMANATLRADSAPFATFLALRYVAFLAIVGAPALFIGMAASLMLESSARTEREWAPGTAPSSGLVAQWIVPAVLGAALRFPSIERAIYGDGVFAVLRFAAFPTIASSALFAIGAARRASAGDKRSASIVRSALSLLAPIAAAAAVALFVRKPTYPLLADGSFMRALRYGQTVFEPNGEIVHHSDGWHRAVTTCMLADKSMEMDFNGKPEMTSVGDLPNQLFVAHIPMMLHPAPRAVALAGTGTGIAAGAVATYPVETIACVDDEPAVIESAKRFIGPTPAFVTDSRIKTFASFDVRDFMLRHRAKFDVVISQPSNPWLAGMDLRFTREYFEAARSALREGGIFSGWIEGYAVDFESFRGVIAAFLDVFPHAMLWCGQPCEYLIVGSMEPLKAPADRMLARFERRDVAKNLATLDIKSVPDFIASFVAGTEDLRLMCDGARPATDATTTIAFSTARAMRDPKNPGYTMAGVEAFRSVSIPWLVPGAMEPTVFDALEARALTNIQARGEATVARHIAFTENREKGFAEHARIAARMNPNDYFIVRMAKDIAEEGAWAMTRGDYRLAAMRYGELLNIQTNSLAARLGAGAAESHLGNTESAYWHFVRAVELDPARIDSRLALAGAAWANSDTAESIRQYRAILEKAPNNIPALHNLAVVLSNAEEPYRDLDEAAKLAERACEAGKWRDPRIISELATIYSRQGRNVEAIKLRERINAMANQGR